MKEFNFSSGTNLVVDDNVLLIERVSGKSAIKSLLAGRTMGRMAIKLSSITGLILNADFLVICASGLPTPSDFKLSSIADVKQYPNCVVAKAEELAELYEFLYKQMS